MNSPFYKNLALWMVIGLIVIVLFNVFQASQPSRDKMVFSDFLKRVESGEVREVLIRGKSVSGKLADGNTFRTFTADYPDLIKALKDKGVKIAVEPEDSNPWYAYLLQWVPMLLFIGVWIFFMRQMQGGGAKALSFGKARARLISEKQNKVTFQDVAGVDEAKEELREIIEFLKDPPKFQKLGGKIPKGVLLVGPPGTGKTLLAKAIAGEANVPFFSISGSDFVEMFVGVGASRVRDLFEQGKKHAPCIPLAPNVALNVLARGTSGFSGADLANLVNEAALLAARQDKKTVEMMDFENAKDKVLMGVERRSMIIPESEKRTTAYHEGGHALVAYLLPGADPLHKVTIIPRGRALGLTMQLPTDDRYSYSKEYLVNQITILLGGRSAEEIVFQQQTTGAGNDLEKATEMARKMVCEWGMSDKMGPLTFGKAEEHIFLGREISRPKDYSEETAILIDSEIKRIVTDCAVRARQLLETNLEKLYILARALLERETLDGEEINRILLAPPFQEAPA